MKTLLFITGVSLAQTAFGSQECFYSVSMAPGTGILYFCTFRVFVVYPTQLFPPMYPHQLLLLLVSLCFLVCSDPVSTARLSREPARFFQASSRFLAWHQAQARFVVKLQPFPHTCTSLAPIHPPFTLRCRPFLPTVSQGEF